WGRPPRPSPRSRGRPGPARSARCRFGSDGCAWFSLHFSPASDSASPMPSGRSTKQVQGEQDRRGDAEQQRTVPGRAALRQRGDRSESDRDLEERHRGGEPVVVVEKLVGLVRFLVPLLLLFPRLLLDLLLFLAVALLLLGVVARR